MFCKVYHLQTSVAMSVTRIDEQLERMYESYSDALFRHILFRISDRERAKDLVQETFTKTWNYISTGTTHIENEKAFLYKVANHLIIDWFRKKKELSLDRLQEVGFDPSGNDHHKFVNQAEVTLLMKFINNLDEKYRDVVIMNYIDDLPIKEIAVVLGETENNISVRLHRGIKKLKELLG